MRKFMTSLTTVAALSLAAIPVLGLTQAANAAEPVARISVGDLNLSNPAQAALFKARVETAANALCRAKARNHSLDMPHGVCVAEVGREVSRNLTSPQRKALQFAARAQAVEVAAQ
ncbi:MULTISPECIES: UrcA family protein [unclassified Caulobacter]|uniref:UrcA family protein n=1 Tax=unclassified Caulobacter TaxID=2648921 RepID=UPI000D3A806E|nr:MULTISPECIES: UrcA family protein [unclassified Caulobacter]PTS88495.1 UrcA family protein [Caulobacter sp. HMWF009]PTT09734.1 UrcA family protein [Caulobacter sp. HMWF025]